MVEYFQLVDLFNGEHRGLLIGGVALSCDQRRTERTHDAGDVRADGFAVGDPLKASENSVVVERTALYDDVASQLGGIRNSLITLYNAFLITEQASPAEIFGDGCALFLRLFYL